MPDIIQWSIDFILKYRFAILDEARQWAILNGFNAIVKTDDETTKKNKLVANRGAYKGQKRRSRYLHSTLLNGKVSYLYIY